MKSCLNIYFWTRPALCNCFKINLLQSAIAILFFKIAYNLLCSEMLMGGPAYSQQHFTTIVYEKSEGQTMHYG